MVDSIDVDFDKINIYADRLYKDLQSKALKNYNILSASQGALRVLKNKSMKCPNFKWKEGHTPRRGHPLIPIALFVSLKSGLC